MKRVWKHKEEKVPGRKLIILEVEDATWDSWKTASENVITKLAQRLEKLGNHPGGGPYWQKILSITITDED